MGAASTFNVANAASALTVSNVIAGSFGLTKSGSGTLILTGSNSYTGTTTVNTTGGVSGALQLGNGGTTGSLAGNGTISLGGQVFFRINRSDSVTQSVDFGIISGFANGSGFTYGIIQAGTGTTTLMVNTNFNRAGGVEGIFGVTAGTLRLGTNQAINETGQVTSSLGNSLRVQGGTLDIGTFTNNVRNLYVTNGNAIGNGMLNVFGQIVLGGNGATSLISASLGGAATLGQSAVGSTIILTGSNSYTGITSLFNNSTLNIRNNSALGSTSAGTTVNSSTELQLEGGITVGSETLTLNGTGRSSGGALRSISGTNTYGGPIILGANSRINSDTNLLILTGGITGAAQALTVGGSGNTTINSAIATTTGTLTKDGTGILTLMGSNTYNGTTTISAGTLRVGNNNALGTGTLVLNGGALSASDSVTARILTNNFIVGANFTLGDSVNSAALTFNGTGNLGTTMRTLTINSAVTFAGALTNTAGFTKNGAGTLTLSSSNSYSGGTLINAGALQLNGTNSGSGAITVSGGIFGGTGRASNSAVSMSGGAMTPGDGSSVGTLSIGSLSITGGTLNILLGGSSTSLLAVNGNATLGGALNFSTNAVLTNSTYTFLTFTGSLSGTFSTTNALPTGYQLVYGSNSVYIHALTGLGPITTTFGGGTNAIITGGITNFLVGVTNTAADGSANMVFNATNASNTTGSIGSTTLTPQSGTNVGGLGYNGTNVGLNQIGTVTVSSTNATPSSGTGTGTVTVDVYDHAAGSLTTNSVAFSDVIVGFGGTNLTANIGVTNSNGFRVNLQAIGISTNTNLNLGNIASLTNGAVTNGVLTLGTNQGVGAFTNTVDYTFGDASSLAGANTNLST
ncbi:MAG: autotransporter-associated beta strand repeat-containing protein, partial [Chthoniobacterales bacterium]